ncbi:hypothetical protein cypCar_00014067 [Cyprinus carpio]|nr:hypothetical protein cypCar_00014067 [Cyprinus carpio]
MRMKEISLRQDPDLRKELALLARGCDFVLPSRFKKRLKAFQQGQAVGMGIAGYLTIRYESRYDNITNTAILR